MALFSCSYTNTPFGKDVDLGSKTEGYIAATGNVSLNINGSTINADRVLIVDSRDNTKSFDKTVTVAHDVSRWRYVGKYVSSLGKYITKSVTN